MAAAADEPGEGMISDRSRLVGRFNVIGNPMPRDTGPDGLMVIACSLVLAAATVVTFLVLWSIQGFEAPISQANVNRTTR